MGVIISQAVLLSDDLNHFEEYWSDICRMSLSWDLSHIFLMVRLGPWVWRRKTTEVKGRSHHTLSKAHIVLSIYLINVDVNLETWMEVVFVQASPL